MLTETPRIFVRSPRAFLILFQTVLQRFTAIEYRKRQTRYVCALGPKAEGNIKLPKNKIRFDLQLWKRVSGARI